jgi:hypothetical protein
MDRMEMGSKERRRHGFVFDYTAQNEHGDAKKKRWKDAGGSEGKGDGGRTVYQVLAILGERAFRIRL